MATTSVTMRVDCDDKAKAEQIFSALGLNMSTAFNMFLKQTIRCDGIPFDVTLRNRSDDDYFYSPANLAHLKRSIAQLNSGKISEHELIEVDDDEQDMD
ncbi:MAG: type II toxin-antitoxin system RelB/DinJ family antitoxin [Oscillospiraceae bacterium]|nr:type II toxin-antitoxin system RelB/DinJ family antitoxin [Oscillospiraceae bacterium]